MSNTGTNYPTWRASYSNEDFDRTTSLAYRLTDEDRAAGRPAPGAGYSRENWFRAEEIVRAAQR